MMLVIAAANYISLCTSFTLKTPWTVRHFVRSVLVVSEAESSRYIADLPSNEYRYCTLKSFLSASDSSNFSAKERVGIKLPLLVLNKDEFDPEFMVDTDKIPMPSSHLPEALSTLNIYGMEITNVAHERLMDEALVNGIDNAFYGHVVAMRPDAEDRFDLRGAIGCAAQIMVKGGDEQIVRDDDDADIELPEGRNTRAVLVKGSYRFIVKEVLSTFPYPTAIVDELFDIDTKDEYVKTTCVEDSYETMSRLKLTIKTLDSMDILVKDKLENAERAGANPLEKEILESAGVSVSHFKMQAEEFAAVFAVFKQQLIDITKPTDRLFAIGMMASEIGELSFADRRKMLVTRNGMERLIFFLEAVDTKIRSRNGNTEKSRTTSSSSLLGDKNDDEKELKVGYPPLPRWALTLKKGMRIEYYWNEEWDWSGGTIQDILKIMDELIVTVEFDDGSLYRLPLNGEEKLRWRPSQ